MAITRPTPAQLQALAGRLHMQLSADQAQDYLALMQASFDAYDLIDDLPDDIPPVRFARGAGHRPSAAENPLNAWYYRAKSTVPAAANWPGAPWRSRTISPWPGCR